MLFSLPIGIGTYFLTNFICSFIPVGDLLNLILRALICLIVPNLVYICIFYKTDEFKYLFGILKILLEQ